MKIFALSDFDSGIKKSIFYKIRKFEPDVIIAHGDFCYGEDLRTIVFKNWDKLNNGKKWYELVSSRKAKQLVSASLKQGDEVIRQLDNIGVPVLIVYGNHDGWDYKSEKNTYYFKRFDKIISKYPNIFSIEFTNKQIKNINFVGYGNFNSGPEYDTLNILQFIKFIKFISQYGLLFKRRVINIFVTHNVPYNTRLDKINNKKSPRHGDNVGSKYVRKLIEIFKPKLSVGGHMHENQGKIKLGKTICINTGSASDGQYAEITISDKKIKTKLF